MKNILIAGAVLIVVLILALVLIKPKQIDAPNSVQNGSPETIEANPGNTAGEVDTGCFSDGECFVEVDGKKVTALFGFSQMEVGSVIGVDSFGDLENHIGKQVEVYAQDNSDGTYTLYGSAGFYIKVLE
jgi:hypothetical protein